MSRKSKQPWKHKKKAVRPARLARMIKLEECQWVDRGFENGEIDFIELRFKGHVLANLRRLWQFSFDGGADRRPWMVDSALAHWTVPGFFNTLEEAQLATLVSLAAHLEPKRSNAVTTVTISVKDFNSTM